MILTVCGCKSCFSTEYNPLVTASSILADSDKPLLKRRSRPNLFTLGSSSTRALHGLQRSYLYTVDQQHTLPLNPLTHSYSVSLSNPRAASGYPVTYIPARGAVFFS